MKKFVLKNTKRKKENYSIDYHSELNEQQYNAVTSIDGPQLIIAGAGTGKTRTLVYRVAYLVENGIKPESILLLTFTRKAAQEMMKRASNILDERCNRVAGGTFHSFSNFILRKYAELIDYSNNFTVIDRADSESLIGYIISNLGLNKKERRFPRKRTVLNIVSKSINTTYSVREILEKEYPQFIEEEKEIINIGKQYTHGKKTRNLMDYDDLLTNMVKLLTENEKIRQKLSNTYNYVMIDEYQDTNHIQALYASLIASEHENIMVVGDDAQSIYSFRGANFRNIMDFPIIFPKTELHTIEQNYRSTQPILDLTNQVIENAEEKYSKELFTDIEGIDKPIFIVPKDKFEQARFICQKVLELRNDGVELRNIGVLFRAGFHSNELEIELNEQNIPFVKFGGIKFIEAAHIKDVIAILRVTYNQADAIAWIRLLQLIKGVGAKTADYLVNEILVNDQGIKALISDTLKGKKYYSDLQSLYNLLDQILETDDEPITMFPKIFEFYSPIIKQKYDDYKKRELDLQSLLEISDRYSSTEKFLTDMSLEPPETSQVKAVATDKDDENLILSTVHSAKGLEWHTVFVIQLLDGFFPSSYSLESPESIEEERRLFYVACTRAKKNLFLLSPNLSFSRFSSETISYSEPSRFLTEIEPFGELTERWELTFDKSENGQIDEETQLLEDGKSKDTFNRIINYFKLSE
ncbi:MAG: ATP-dependent DNA helicase PcrA [Candidatus Scalindua rubra]|uniref:DNA 3'-5' helicase n=1 Tax=Candidatus Scalindua rubra TaxID=1872076 RepID=A0A1E3X2V6_9BACT|nr:MAG: ATP-dependent DNA helicase PcrA [Candidatus Scalindua rubra]